MSERRTAFPLVLRTEKFGAVFFFGGSASDDEVGDDGEELDISGADGAGADTAGADWVAADEAVVDGWL